jgi:protein-S-isoprenylcysteine O-methyltransferase
MHGTALRALDLWVFFLWLIADNVVVFRRRAKPVTRADRFSLMGILVANWVGITVAISLGAAGIGALGIYTEAMQIAGLALLVAGIVTRSAAIVQLGRFHAPIVAIQTDHRVVDTGLYRRIRHPSYLGACIALSGFALGQGSWLGAVFMLACALAAYAYRIEVEERALLASLGETYAAYRKRTHRLIPGVY